MLMSTSSTQARSVLFGDIKAKVQNSPWFRQGRMPDDRKKTELHFPKEIWLVPGNSEETTFEGFNVLGGVIDEGDSHKTTARKDYAEEGWNTIHARISSRFMDPATNDHRGLLLAIGQMKSANGFMSRKKKELESDSKAHVTMLKIWESFGWEKYYKNGKPDVFWFDTDRMEEVSVEYARDVKSANIMPIPETFRKDFETNPIKALRDLAGIPPESTDPFIVLMDRVDAAMTSWEREFEHLGTPDDPYLPVDFSCTNPTFDNRLRGDSLPRALHIDIAYSDAVSSDALGMVMGHVPRMVDLDGELKPFIVIDFALRLKAKSGNQIVLQDIRRLIYYLRQERKFKIRSVTFDGTESLEMLQSLRRMKYSAAKLSVDKNLAPYEDLRDALYERRIAVPRYITERRPGTGDKVDIIRTELSQLTNPTGKKVDHPPSGSKDCADALAAVVHVLQGDSSFRRGARPSAGEETSVFDVDLDRMFDISADQLPDDALAALFGGKRASAASRGWPSSDRSRLAIPRAPRGLPAIDVDPISVVDRLL
jgi:hypothetical protein